jgi:hypothetical protein
MNKSVSSAIGLSILAAGAASAQYSSYLPESRQILVTPLYMYSYYDDAWIGKTSMPIEQDQHSVYLQLEYGFTDWLAGDLSLGYSWAEIDGAGSDDGLADTTLGLRFQLLNEDAGAPLQLSWRVGGIIPGTYDEDFPFSSGDGAWGVETSLLLGKRINEWLGLYGDFGYRWRDDDVPQELFGSGGLYVTCGPVTLSAGYRGSWGVEGDDIGDPGFGSSFGFPQTREIQHNIEVALGFSDAGNRYYQLFYSRTLDGRNTGEHNVFGFAVTFPFGGEPEPMPMPPPGKNPVAPSK